MLTDYPLMAQIPAQDLERAARFYADRLGLKPVDEIEGTAVIYQTGGTMFALYATQFAGTAEHTLAAWQVDDLEAEMAALRKQGVTFEDYDMPGLKTENGVATMGESRAAWFKDSEGNTLALFEMEE